MQYTAETMYDVFEHTQQKFYSMAVDLQIS
jgi:hypothetical protein